MRFWWVNHKKTSQQEIAEGYLWSPKSEANGARSQFYDNMKLANPGDIVLSFANGLIAHIGMVGDYAITASKPDSFGSIGGNWGDDGWLLPVAWSLLSNPVRPKDRIRELAPLLPMKYSPIHPLSGNGNQKAYFAEISQSIFNLLMDSDSLHSMRASSVEGVDKYIRNLEEITEKRLIDDQELNSTVKEQLILARHGQGLFRERVSKIEKSCRLTKIDNPRLLIASHIKPWRLCRTAEERLDGSNGLLLAPHVDHLFDRGLIGFEESGKIILSPRLDCLDLHKLGLSEAGTRNCGRFNDRQAEYLSFHRNQILLS